MLSFVQVRIFNKAKKKVLLVFYCRSTPNELFFIHLILRYIRKLKQEIFDIFKGTLFVDFLDLLLVDFSLIMCQN